MKARKVLLLLLILGSGASIELAWSVRNHLDIGPAGCRVLGGRFYGPSFSFTSEERKQVPAGTALDVVNAFGGVQVAAGAPGEVRVKLRTVVFLPTEEAARAFASNVRLAAGLDGSRLRIATNRSELELRDVGFETHLEVRLPPGTAVKVTNERGPVDVADVAEADVDNSYDALRLENVKGAAVVKGRQGDVTVSSVGGPLSVTWRHGDVKATDVGGGVTLDVEHGNVSVERAGGLEAALRHGDLDTSALRGDLGLRGEHAGVRASDVGGAVSIETGYRDVQVAKVAGEARVRTEHGDIHAEDVQGAVHAEAAYGDVALDRIGGPVEVKVVHGGLRAAGLAKGARVEASGDDVEIEGFHGSVEVDARRGSVHLVPEGPLTDAVSVTAASGSIRLEVPAGSAFELSASARSGDLEVDVPGLAVTESGPGRLAAKLGGGGSLVKLSTDHGDVSVEPRADLASRR